jgi:5'-nucleotidase
MPRPLILVSNDDGITSKGILTLINVMKELGDVLVVAPDSPQSGMGHAITVGESLRLEENLVFKGVKAYQCSGTPAVCKDGQTLCVERSASTRCCCQRHQPRK